MGQVASVRIRANEELSPGVNYRAASCGFRGGVTVREDCRKLIKGSTNSRCFLWIAAGPVGISISESRDEQKLADEPRRWANCSDSKAHALKSAWHDVQ